jgi:exosortase family protein XrtG
VALILLWPPGSLFLQKIRLDGQFDDWKGRTSYHIDFKDDASKSRRLKSMSWGTNENERILYFMVELREPVKEGSSYVCRLNLDINDNGSYNNAIDKFAKVLYEPTYDTGEVLVELYSSQGKLLSTYEGDWGEGSISGGSCFEFSIPMADLHVYPAQYIRFYLSTAVLQDDRIPSEGDIQWKPFPVVVRNRIWITFLALCWLTGSFILYRHRIWLFYYIWSAVGFTFLFILLFRGSLLEYRIEHLTGLALHHLLNYFDIITFVFDKAPGTILVFIKIDESWTTIDIDIESSGILEIGVFLGLILFYPVCRLSKRILYSLVGVAALLSFNMVRLMIIVAIIYSFGRNFNFLAHTLFGRILFFFFIVLIYWHLMTRPTLVRVKEDVENA